MDIEIDTSELDRYSKTLKEQKKLVPRAIVALLNNMAFGTRDVVLDYIPRVMIVRNRAFLRSSILVTKAKAGTSSPEALLGSKSRDRFSGLREQEFGGVLTRQTAYLEARSGSKQKKMKQSARLKGNILKPEDISVAHEKNWEHRIHVFLEMLQRKTAFLGSYKGAFVIHGSSKFRSGLMSLDKLTRGSRAKKQGTTKTTRQVKTLQRFEKGQKKVKRKPWMKPSIDKYLQRSNPHMEWLRAVRSVKLFMKK